MKRAFPVLLRSAYVALVAACSAFLLFHFAQRTPWYKQRLYRQLLAGTEEQRLRAASTLVRVGGQAQLLRAIQAEEANARAVAKKALEYLWFNAAGPRAFGLVQSAYQAAERQELDKAVSILSRVVKEFPTFAEGWNQRASVYWQMGEYDKSLSDSERALALNPNHYGAWQGLGVCRLKRGDVMEACRCLRKALQLLPYDDATREALENCQELLRKTTPAKERQNRIELI